MDEYRVKQMHPSAEIGMVEIVGLPDGSAYYVRDGDVFLSALCGCREFAWKDAASRL